MPASSSLAECLGYKGLPLDELIGLLFILKLIIKPPSRCSIKGINNNNISSNNRYHILSTFVPDFLLHTSHVVSHLIFKVFIWVE